MPSLVAASGPLAGSRFVVEGESVIGRSPSCEISIADSRASRRHARLTFQAGKLSITDLGSRNGTLVNGERLDSSRTLEPGDRVVVGSTAFVVDPPLAAEVAESTVQPDEVFAAEDLLPFAGLEGVLLGASGQLFSAESSGAVVRRVGEELLRAVGADVVSALMLQEGSLLPALILGAKEVVVPRPLVRAALDERRVARLGGAAAPLALRNSDPVGVLFTERRDEPFGREELSLLAGLARLGALAIAALRQRQAEVAEAEEVLVGQSRSFRRALELARKVAYSDLSACFVGERGTGKRMLARFSIARGPRAMQPVAVVDCRSSSAETQLFGGRTRASAFARADGGTLVLIGIDGLPRHLTSKLLDCLQRGHAPGAEGSEIRFDVRLYSTARTAPSRLASQGELPFELANLCAGVEVEVPPLRERPGDLPLLFEHFIKELTPHGAMPLRIPPEILNLLGQYSFPGNVREVHNLVERLNLLGLDEVLPQHLPPETRQAGGGVGETLAALVESVEREAISRAMTRAHGKKVEAARMLDISRPTLDKKLQEYGLGSTRKRGNTGETGESPDPDNEVTDPTSRRPTDDSTPSDGDLG
jgi:DNA-binding NtrC family response regulator